MFYRIILDILNSLGMGLAVPVFVLIIFGLVYIWKKKDLVMGAYRELTRSIQKLSDTQTNIREELFGVHSDVKRLGTSLETHIRNHSIHVQSEYLMYRDVCHERHRAIDGSMSELKRKVFNGR